MWHWVDSRLSSSRLLVNSYPQKIAGWLTHFFEIKNKRSKCKKKKIYKKVGLKQKLKKNQNFQKRSQIEKTSKFSKKSQIGKTSKFKKW